MNIEQTSQLIQLILNSVLMVFSCIVLLSVLLLRHVALVEGLRNLNREYLALINHPVIFKSDRLSHLKHLVQLRRKRYKAAHGSILVICYALILFVLSTFVLALRTVLGWNGLIQLSLNLFMAGIGLLLLGIVWAALDFHQSKRSLLDELSGAFNATAERSPLDKSKTGIPPIQVPRHLPPVGSKVSSMR